MVVRLFTTSGWEKTTTLDSGSYFMRWQVPPMRAEEICSGHFQPCCTLPLYHLMPHTNVMKGNSHQTYANLDPLGVRLRFWLQKTIIAPITSQWPVVGDCYEQDFF